MILCSGENHQAPPIKIKVLILQVERKYNKVFRSVYFAKSLFFLE